MSQIENAAREIREFVQLEWCDTRDSDEDEFAKIIHRHLFPVVKPEDVDDGFYWVKLPGHPWAIRQPWIHKDERGETLMFNTYAASECVVCGPVPMPE